jgi:hypothetical protein
MASNDQELRLLRGRIEALEARLDRLENAGSDPSAMVVQTTAVTSYPTAAGVVYGVKRCVVTGPEKEGGTPVFTVVGSVFYATHIGATPPPVSTNVIAIPVRDRLVFRY